MDDAIMLADKVTDFIFKYATYKDKEELRQRVQRHIEYKTCKVVLDEKGAVAAVCCWNISPDGSEAFILDMVIREDYRKKDIMRRILHAGLKIWQVKYLRWNRGYREDGSMRWPESKRFKVESFLRRSA